ncbi:sensor histidine kinase [Microbispora cellulosiformans]|uniref:histidine kinase n=1 Tax=Microbispora cellulosiformans TaxID=2614688 RepID=A0A5J5KC38_9ACTN|nr:sensor domain-containing protein [Microbispora cellulosiformans]KAA9381378.1 sensor histidine kinase [Microbispora cellulosiformans]
MRGLRRALIEPVRARTWRETGHLLLGAPISVMCLLFVVVTAYALLAGLTVVGLAALAAVVTAARVVGVVERARARVVLKLRVAAPPPRPRTRPGAAGWIRDALADRTGWRCLLYAVLAVPLGVAQAYLVALWWGLGALSATCPLWYPWLPSLDGHQTGEVTVAVWRWYPVRWPYPPLICVLGVAALLVAPWLVHALTALDRLRLRLVAASGEDERIQTMTRRRDQAVEQAGAHLRRIERDLHDGAQVRMVALAMELGRAREELEAEAAPHPAAARVAAAHAEAKQALAELRELARGIYPAVLTDLGLDGAVPLLTARCHVPVTTDIGLTARPPATVEATAYFCVGELLANLSKHSGADNGWVRVRRRGDLLSIEVGDDGAGGAVAHPTGGLAGLTDRVGSVGGVLTIDSPAGGPTLITVELPCAS